MKQQPATRTQESETIEDLIRTFYMIIGDREETRYDKKVLARCISHLHQASDLLEQAKKSEC